MPLVLCCADHNDRKQLMRLASAYQVEHVVLFSDMVSIAEAVDIFQSATPIIASFEPVSDPSLACVRTDGAAASAEIVERLVADGRRSFAYISGRASSWVDKKRRGWFSDALAPHGLAFEASGQGDYSYDSGYKEAVMLPGNPTASPRWRSTAPPISMPSLASSSAKTKSAGVTKRSCPAMCVGEVQPCSPGWPPIAYLGGGVCGLCDIFNILSKRSSFDSTRTEQRGRIKCCTSFKPRSNILHQSRCCTH